MKILVNSLTSGFVLAVTLALSAPPTHAGVIINITQVGSDVVATGSGFFNLNALTLGGSFPSNPDLSPTIGRIVMGPVPGPNPMSVYDGITGPLSYGSGLTTLATSGFGDIFGQCGAVNGIPSLHIFMPQPYVSGTPLSATDIYSNATINSLGLTPGTYTWNWGTGADADFLTLQITTPEPTSLVLIPSGLLALALLARRRKFQKIRTRGVKKLMRPAGGNI